LVSRRLPAFLLGRNPHCRVIGTSYSDSLAGHLNRDVQKIIESPSYQRIFPATKLSQISSTGWQAKKTSSYFEVSGANGYYRSAGIGGSITGFGADVAIVDDYCKNQIDADSPNIRQRTYEWFGSTLLTRLERGAGVLITATRWNDDDLVGRLLSLAAKDPDADQWTVLNLPAIAESDPTELDPRAPGEALWPAKYSAPRLAGIKATIGSRAFTAMYQQRPSPEQGMIIQKSWWRYYTVPPERFEKTILSFDLSFVKSATADFVVGVVLGKAGANVYLLDMIRGRFSFTESLTAFIRLASKWPDAEAKYVEQAANGAALVDALRSQISGIIPVPPHGSKVARLNAVSPRIEAGNVWLPDPKVYPWVSVVVDEFTAFPAGANDDIVDAITQGLARLPVSRVDDFLPLGLGTGTTFFPQAEQGAYVPPWKSFN
jgi:predicted phage terminase large subunit-like protein